jgi:hypothetical protein
MSTALAALQREFMAGVEGEGPCAPGVAVYRRAVRENRLAALAAAYPVVRRLVGEAFFREAVACYARAYPSTSGDLGLFGERMGDFLAGYPHAAALAYLGDMARLEWAVHESLCAADAPRLDFARLGELDPCRYAALRFTLAPSVRRVASPYSIHALWHANQPQHDGTARHDEPERVLVWRQDGAVQVAAVDEAEWEFLDGLARGEALAACHGRLRDDSRLAGLLARHALAGVICGVSGGMAE